MSRELDKPHGQLATGERKYLIQVLTTVKGNVSRAAELAGKDRAEFYRLLRKHTLLPTAFKATA